VEQAEAECPGVRIVQRERSLAEAVGSELRRRRARRLGFEPESLTVELHGTLTRAARPAKLVPVPGAVRDLRLTKDAAEVRATRRAVRAAEDAWAAFRPTVEPGQTERALAARLDACLRDAGADGPAFPTICAVDASASMPHARPGKRRLKRRGLLLVDFGARVGGYVSDLTRVLVTSRIPPRVREVYELVREAQAAALKAVRPGISFRDLDAAARDVIARAGHADAYRHGLGHGIGREVHEAPGIGPRATGTVAPGMVFTIEPGVYLPGRFGVRIEDDVLVTETGCRVLTHLEKDLEAMVL
jgi:Xaa-Pro aminopeptidase